MEISENIEMYLVNIALLSEEEANHLIQLSRLAEELNVQTVSVNQMVRKLDEAKLVKYLPYKGVELTKEGIEKTQKILRYRRLWEVFFVNSLNFSPSEADELACRMEHISTNKVSERLSNYLDDPIVSPSGKTIPLANGKHSKPNHIPLSNLQAGEKGEIIKFNSDAITSKYLVSQGFSPGIEIEVIAQSNIGNLLIKNGESSLNLTTEVAEKILVQSN